MRPEDLVKGKVYFDVRDLWVCQYIEGVNGDYIKFKRLKDSESLGYGKFNLDDLIPAPNLTQLLYGVENA